MTDNITLPRATVQQALEALIDAANVLSAPMFADAVDVLQAALEQQAEPVAYDKTAMNSFVIDLYDSKMKEGKHGHYETMFHVVHQAIKKVAPPQRPWVGLTDEEIDANQTLRYHFSLNNGPVTRAGIAIVETIEAMLKAKNHG